MATTVFVSAILNLAWAAICLAAFAWLIAFETRRGRANRRTIIYRAVALSLALVSLFPCISASDDWVKLRFFNSASSNPAPDHSRQTPSNDPSDSKALGTLVRLLEALDAVQITVSLAFFVILCLFALALVETHRSLDRFLPARAGRAPPSSISV